MHTPLLAFKINLDLCRVD